MILLTTSRRPTRRIRTFCKDLANSIPDTIRINRGKLNLDGVAEKSIEFNADRVIIVNRWKGGPGKIEFFRVESSGLKRFPPTIYVKGVKLRREFKTGVKHVKALSIIVSSKGNDEIMKVAKSLSEFLNIPITTIEEAAKQQAAIHILPDEENNIKITFVLLPKLVEVGPRIRVRHIIW